MKRTVTIEITDEQLQALEDLLIGLSEAAEEPPDDPRLSENDTAEYMATRAALLSDATDGAIAAGGVPSWIYRMIELHRARFEDAIAAAAWAAARQNAPVDVIIDGYSFRFLAVYDGAELLNGYYVWTVKPDSYIGPRSEAASAAAYYHAAMMRDMFAGADDGEAVEE